MSFCIFGHSHLNGSAEETYNYWRFSQPTREGGDCFIVEIAAIIVAIFTVKQTALPS